MGRMSDLWFKHFKASDMNERCTGFLLRFLQRRLWTKMSNSLYLGMTPVHLQLNS
ncbi:hypothetical protein CIP106467_1500 [Citrobacter europaeus]|nr:hypothetical protein CIP106467_1500 [Citrobacter europaeus]